MHHSSHFKAAVMLTCLSVKGAQTSSQCLIVNAYAHYKYSKYTVKQACIYIRVANHIAIFRFLL